MLLYLLDLMFALQCSNKQASRSWQVLKQTGVTEFFYGWSYILAWIGIGQCLFAAILFLSAARCIRSEKRTEQAKNMQYLMPVYPDKRNPYGMNYAYAYPGPYHHLAQVTFMLV